MKIKRVECSLYPPSVGLDIRVHRRFVNDKITYIHKFSQISLIQNEEGLILVRIYCKNYSVIINDSITFNNFFILL